MSAAVASPAKKAARKSGTKKPKTVASHPPFKAMISKAITSLKERGGSSRTAILTYIMANYKVGTDAAKVNQHMKVALRNGIKAGVFLAPKGPSGKFKLSESKKAASAGAPKKPRAKSPKKKATTAKKPAAKKAKSPKKPKAKKSPAKKAPKKAKSPKKKASPKKKVAKK